MAIRNAVPFTFRPFGCCDVIDGTNAQPGAMASLKNLIPNPRNLKQFVPRPASVQETNFSGFATPGKISALFTVGTRDYGMVASARNAGKDEPFCYDRLTGAFVTIGNVTAANSPASPPTSGDWTPPIMTQIGNRILITHPGYSGANKFGWIDMRTFVLSTLTGSTHTSTTIDTLSSNPITLGVAVGDLVAGAGISANTFVVSMTAAAIVLSQATTASAGGVALTFTSGTKAAPVYGAGDTNGTNLVGVPKAVGQFNGRAWFAVANGLQYTDSLVPWQITNGTQALTLGDNTDVTAVAGLPLTNQLGGIVQALIAFKGAAPYWQITGDQTTADLKLDQVPGSVGTLAPLSIVSAVRGLSYMSPDGLRLVDPMTALASEPIGANGQGITAPFIYAVAPSRICAAFNRNIYRASTQNGGVDGQPAQEWWYHFSLGIWTGPHDFPAGLIQACRSGDTDFILAANGINAKLWQSTVSPSASSTYTENSVAMNFMWTTSLLPDNQSGNSNQIVETSVGLVLPASQVLTVQALDEGGAALDTLGLSGNGAGAAVWGAFIWGVGVWGGALPAYRQYALPWSKPLVFRQATLTMFGPSVSGLSIGNIISQIQPTGYQGAYAA